MNMTNPSLTPPARATGFSGLRLPRFIADLSLQAKLTVAFLLITIIPLALLTFLNDRSTRQALTDEANQGLLAAAAQLATQLDGFIEANLDTVRTQAQLPGLADYLSLPANERLGSAEEAEVTAILAALSRQDPVNISSYALLDEQGIDVVDTFTPDIGIDKSNRAYFQVPVETGLPYVTPVEFSQTVDEVALYFGSPVRNKSGQIIGVLRVRYRASVLQSLVAQSNEAAGAGSFAILLDENHVRLAHSTQQDLIFKSVVPLETEAIADLQAARRLPTNRLLEELSTNIPDFERGLNNVETSPYFNTVLVATGDELDSAAVVKLETQPWFVVFAQPQVEFLASVNTLTRTAVIVVVIMLVIVVVIALGMGQIISRPVTRLTAVAQRITQGDLTAQAVVESGDEIGVLAQTFNTMTAQLQMSLADSRQRALSLEQQTQVIQTSAEVSRRLSTILDRQALTAAFAEEMRNAFHYYHAHIFLLDETGENLLMTSGTGRAGATMLARGHSIPIGQGLVGRAAATNMVVLVPDLSKEEGWIANPLLPETKASLSIPIAIGEEVMGVLNVQHNVANSLSENDVNVLQSITNQIAITLRNANIYADTQHQAEQEFLVNTINQKIDAATTVEEVMQVAVRELGRALGAEQTAIRLLDKDNGRHKTITQS